MTALFFFFCIEFVPVLFIYWRKSAKTFLSLFSSIYLLLWMHIHERRKYLKVFRVTKVNGAHFSIFLGVAFLLKHNVDCRDC